MIRKKKITLSTTQIILLSFLVTILVGSALLALPISSASSEAVPYLDALFTATTSTCVTGLVTLPTVSTWSVFGQIVILLLIQIGGLGIITIMSGLMLLLNRKMGIGDRLLIQDALNLNTMSGLAKFVKNVLFGTLIIEGIGAVLQNFLPMISIAGQADNWSGGSAKSSCCRKARHCRGLNRSYKSHRTYFFVLPTL